jgi:hypothetical protein
LKISHATAQAFADTGYSIERGVADWTEQHTTTEMNSITWSEFLDALDDFGNNLRVNILLATKPEGTTNDGL